MNSMVEILAAHADKQPDRLFVADNEGTAYTYGQAWAAVRMVAVHLTEQYYLKAGDRVMVECNQDAGYLLIDLACQLIGAVFVPVENGASHERKQNIFRDTDSVLWIYGKEPLDFVTSVPEKNLLESGAAPQDSFPFPEGKSTAQILYTTGTTGASKGIVISNRANVALAENIRDGVHMKPGNTELIPLPVSHSHALRCCYANLLNGGSIILMDGLLRIKDVFRLIDTYHVTAMDLSPSAAALLIKLSKGAFWEYGRRLDYIQIGTASLPEGLKEQLLSELPSVRLYNFYGSTESGRSCVLDFSLDRGLTNCIGKPTKNAKIVFVNDEHHLMQRATEEDPGLLASKGPMNMDCYWKNPELTADILKDGFIFTNDIGYMDADGYVFVLGRKDDVINYNGIKIAPDEIEEVAIRYSGVKDAACVPQKDALAGQIPKLFIVVEEEKSFSLKDFMAYLNGVLDANKVPKRIEFIQEIPRTYNGKIQRKKLRDPGNN